MTKELQKMKLNTFSLSALAMSAFGFTLLSGCVVLPDGRLAFQPIVIAPTPPAYAAPQPVYGAPQQPMSAPHQAVYMPPQPVYTTPPPLYAVPSMVPETYFWDGFEYVGIVGSQCFYLGVGNVWLICEPFRIERFYGWQRNHPDWRYHGVHNDRYRTAYNYRGSTRYYGKGKSEKKDQKKEVH